MWGLQRQQRLQWTQRLQRLGTSMDLEYRGSSPTESTREVLENCDLAGEALQGLVCKTFHRFFNLTAQMCSELDSHCHVYFS
jgi:hypothetical protein